QGCGRRGIGARARVAPRRGRRRLPGGAAGAGASVGRRPRAIRALNGIYPPRALSAEAAPCNHGAVIIERSTHPQFVSNTYLVADGGGGPAFFIDAGGPVEPLIEAAERRGLAPTHVLLTHHHFDHVSEVGALRARWPAIEVLISPAERALLAGAG